MCHLAHAQEKVVGKAKVIAQKVWQDEDLNDILQKQTDLGCQIMYCPDRGGFVLISEDLRVLAYDDNANFSIDKMPTHIRTWIKGYKQMTASSKEAPEKWIRWIMASSLSVENVKPLLGGTLWGQDSPYNIYCPVINGKRCPTGCVATALAQLMRYHQWPVRGTGVIDYLSSSAQIPITYNSS